MIYALILAGGIGSRMAMLKNSETVFTHRPKPIIVHTLEKFYVNSKIDRIVVSALSSGFRTRATC